ncbi:MAG: GNAT family N-acetyltransferase [Ktedonobacteraceae bacterium]
MSEVAIRQAQAEDREAVLAFCAHTWDWGDYIEHVWDEWLHNPAGLLLVALVKGQPVGLLHMQMLSETEAWQEGMRIDPAYRQQGIATQMSMEAGAEAMRRGATVVRLLIESTNNPSLNMADREHNRRVGAIAQHSATPVTSIPQHNAGLDEPVLATLDDLDEIIAYLNVSSIFPAVGGLYYAGFTACRISDTLLKAKLQAEQVYVLRRWGRLDGLAIVEPRGNGQERYLFIGYIDGTTESISLIAYALRRRLPALGFTQIRAAVPDLMMVRDAFTAAEYVWDNTIFYTYERSLV